MKLSEVLKEWRCAKKLSVREAAKVIGTSPATFNRIERGENCDSITLSKILRWLLDDSPVQFRTVTTICRASIRQRRNATCTVQRVRPGYNPGKTETR